MRKGLESTVDLSKHLSPHHGHFMMYIVVGTACWSCETSNCLKSPLVGRECSVVPSMMNDATPVLSPSSSLMQDRTSLCQLYLLLSGLEVLFSKWSLTVVYTSFLSTLAGVWSCLVGLSSQSRIASWCLVDVTMRGKSTPQRSGTCVEEKMLVSFLSWG